MTSELLDYSLPDGLVARFPSEPRDHCRLLVAGRSDPEITHARFDDLPKWLNDNDLLVFNNTKVIPARLWATNNQGKKFEILLLQTTQTTGVWECLVRPGKKVRHAEEVRFSDGSFATIRPGFVIEFPIQNNTAFLDWLDSVGETPLPPYLDRPTVESDRGNYQTLFAKYPGSVAAPTAGLHFTQPLLESIRTRGIRTAEITLHIGYGTFAPIHGNIDAHPMHPETYCVPDETFRLMRQTRENGGRIIAVGTTVVRTLESIPAHGLNANTRLFIQPGHAFQWIDGLVTNFHLPRSSLLVLVAAFLGTEKTLETYRLAIHERYRFYSYGDAMFLI